jgi:hypothetical protein
MDPDAAENARLESSLRSWLSSQLPAHAASLSDENISLHDVLKSGVILCEMMNIIKPGSMKRISTISTAYKQLENLQNYLNMCRIMGMQASQLFESSDLVNGKFLSSILINLKTLQGIHERYSKPTSGMAASTSSSNLASSSSSTNLATTKTTSSPSPAAASTTSAPSPTVSSGNATIARKNSYMSVGSLSPEGTTAPKPTQEDVIRNVVNTVPDEKIVALVQRWIEVLLTVRIPAGKTLFDWLKSGVILLRILNALKPDICKVIYEGNIGFKQIENVQRYLKLCPIAVDPAVPLFSVADLTDERDLIAVTSHLHAMITLVQRDSKWAGPTLDTVHHDLKLASVSASLVSTPDTASTASSSTQTSPSTSVSSETTNEVPTPSLTSTSSAGPKTQPIALQPSETPDLPNIPKSSSLPPVNSQATLVVPTAESTQQKKPAECLIMPSSAIPRVSQPQNNSDALPIEAPPVASKSLSSPPTRSVDDNKSEIESLRTEIEAERRSMQEERRIFAEQMKAETERQLREMASKLEEEYAAVIANERQRSATMAVMLEEERREREKLASQLEEERKSRKVVLEESDRQREEVTIQAQKQMQAVAERLQEETSKRLEAMASKITNDAVQKAEQELRKKDEHLMKQLDRERVLRSRLDALEEEKKSLSRTFERKFAALETELKAAKTATKVSAQAPQNAASAVPTITTTLDTSVASSLAPVDPDTIKEFREWNSKWRSNRMLTKQLTRTLTELSSRSTPAQLESEADSISLATDEQSGLEPFEFVLRSIDEESENAPLSLITPRSELEMGGNDDEEPLDLDLDRKQWLDDDWSEEEDWEESDELDDFEEDDEGGIDGRSEEGDDADESETSTDRTPVKGSDGLQYAAPKKSPVSPSKDEWSQFSGMNLSKFS